MCMFTLSHKQNSAYGCFYREKKSHFNFAEEQILPFMTSFPDEDMIFISYATFYFGNNNNNNNKIGKKRVFVFVCRMNPFSYRRKREKKMVKKANAHKHTYTQPVSKNGKRISRLQAVDMFYVISGKINNISYSALMWKYHLYPIIAAVYSGKQNA